MTYDEALGRELRNLRRDTFLVTVGGAGRAIDGVSVSGSSVILTLGVGRWRPGGDGNGELRPHQQDTAAARIRGLGRQRYGIIHRPRSDQQHSPTGQHSGHGSAHHHRDGPGRGDAGGGYLRHRRTTMGLPAESEFDYQWIRNDGNTGRQHRPGATDSTYVLLAADVGKFIKVRGDLHRQKTTYTEDADQHGDDGGGRRLPPGPGCDHWIRRGGRLRPVGRRRPG